MAADASITIPEDLLPKLEEMAAAFNRTPEDVAAEAIRKQINRMRLERFKKDAIRARGNMTDEQVQDLVDRVIHQDRAEQRGR